MNLVKRAGLVAVCMVAMGQSAGAQEFDNSTITLDTITVTTTKTEKPVIGTFAGTSVVTDQDIDRFQPDRLSDALQGVPGVEVQEDADEPSSAINIRGLQDFGRVNVMIEGARQNFQRAGHGANGIFYIEPELIQTIDIVRGPVATIYGSGAVGGVVNFLLKEARDLIEPDETWFASFKGQYNSNDDGTLVSGVAAWAPVQWLDVVGNVVWQRDDDFTSGNGTRILNTDEDVLSGLVKGTIRFEQLGELKVTYLRQDNEYTTGDPGFQRDTDTVDNTVSGKWLLNPTDNPWVDLSASVYYTDTKTEQTRIDIPVPCIFPICNPVVLGNERFFRIRTIGTDVFNTSRFTTGPFEHTLTYGGDAFRDRVRTVDPLNSGAQFTPSGQRLVYGGFIQDQIAFEEWLELIAALRFDSYELTGPGIDVTGSRVSPKVTLGITFLEGLQVYGTYAEAYRSPAISETLQTGTHAAFPPFDILPNPNLKPETARNFEVGLNLSQDNLFYEGDAFRAKAVVFHNNVSDFIDLVNVTTFNPFGAIQYQNIAKAELTGFELEAAYDAGFMFTTLAYTRVRGKNDQTGQPLTSVYPDKVSTTLGFRFLEDKLTVGGRYTHAWKQDRLPTPLPMGVYESDAYHLVDLFASYDHNRYFSTALTLKNILDEQYTRFRSEDPSPGFSATVSATIKFGG